jgi:hypothetical protein
VSWQENSNLNINSQELSNLLRRTYTIFGIHLERTLDVHHQKGNFNWRNTNLVVAIPTREPWMIWRTFREKKRDAYADWLAPLWLRNSDYLCPVYRDDKKENIVFCIP